MTTKDSSSSEVLFFTAPHCPHCQTLRPKIEAEASNQVEAVNMREVDVSRRALEIDTFGIRATPTVIALRHGIEVKRHVGAGTTQDVERVFAAALGRSSGGRTQIGVVDRTIRLSAAAFLAVIALVSGAWWLFVTVALLMTAGMYDVFTSAQRSKKIRPVDASALISSDNPPVIVDIRTETERLSASIPQDVHIGLGHGFETRIGRLDAPNGILLYCTSGARSRRAVKMLRSAGIVSVDHIEGGLQAWEATNLPVDRN